MTEGSDHPFDWQSIGWIEDGVQQPPAVRHFTVTAEPMPSRPKRPWWVRLYRWWLHIPEPPLPQPPGTQPMVIDYQDGVVKRRVFIPAARVTEDS